MVTLENGKYFYCVVCTVDKKYRSETFFSDREKAEQWYNGSFGEVALVRYEVRDGSQGYYYELKNNPYTALEVLKRKDERKGIRNLINSLKENIRNLINSLNLQEQ